ncbi:PWWP domain-containing protein 2B [Acropora cervicornis]|uniref:PWWP domain-containing protein 2B n=1 Tax=Acropora cervicornis TaxID=6130 RepID=A0AAD9R2S3_ACRCE|nr:PWWP domain-containing protein 2B [Acropora cervicornis]
MACLQAGTVLSATVEQALENCVLVYVKHRSRIFRGVLFDEKNAIVFRTPADDRNGGQEAKQLKVNGGSNVADSASRWSTRQASLYYKRQNNKVFPCRRIPSLFSDVQVLTEADLIKENDRNPENMEDTSSTLTKRPSASTEPKTKAGQVYKGRDSKGRKTDLLNQVNVKSNKSETSLKRKNSDSDISDRPSKKQTQKVNIANKAVQKTNDTRKAKRLDKRSGKISVANDGKGSQKPTISSTKSSSPTHYKLIMARPSSVAPVVSVGSAPRSSQQKSDTVLIIKKVNPSDPMEISDSQGLAMSYSTGKNINENIQDLENGKNETDQKCIQGSEISANKDGSEGAKNISECQTKTAENEMVTGKEENTASVSEQSNVHEVLLPGEKSIDETFSRNSTDSLEKEDKSNGEDIAIKRSVRIKERRARFNINQLLPYIEETQGGSFTEECTLVDIPHLDSFHPTAALRGVSSEFLDSAVDSRVQNPTTTQNQPLKPSKRAKRANTKYTQRTTWQLDPQVAPVDQSDPVGVGDIVWGKVHGHPWWPGKVLAISGIRSEESSNPWDRDAHVSWFGSNTSSIMRLHCLQLFAPNFSKRHKRRKKGCYRLAIRQAKEAMQALINMVNP